MKKKLVIFIIFLLSFSILTTSVNLVSANQFIDGLFDTGYEAGYDAVTVDDEGAETLFDTTIGKFIGMLLSLLGVIFLILMIVGGYTWMTSRGNEQQVTKAKNLIISAIIGLVIVVASYAISYFVISGLSKGALVP